MKLKTLGNSGLRVSELCLGAMTFGEDWGWGANKETSLKMLDLYTESGGNFIDTANIYTNGTSEEFIGEFIKEKRDEFIIASKYTIRMHESDPNAQGNHRKNFRCSLDSSLKRLKTDYIDLYFVHMWDGFTRAEEIAHCMNDAVRSGKILHYGLSDFPAWLAAKIDTYTAANNMERPVSLQLEYNLAQREIERELEPFARAENLSILCWSPLGGGALTGKYLGESPDKEGRVAKGAVVHFDKYKRAKAMEIAQKITELSREINCSPAQLSIAWLLERSPLNIPIVGARKLNHLEDNLKAKDITLPPDVMVKLNDVGHIDLGFPLNFFQSGWKDWFGDVPKRFDKRTHSLGHYIYKFDTNNN